MSQEFFNLASRVKDILDATSGIGSTFVRKRDLKFFAEQYDQLVASGVLNYWEIDFESLSTQIASIGNAAGNIPLRQRIYRTLICGHYAFKDGSDTDNSTDNFRNILEAIEVAIWSDPFLNGQLLLPIVQIDCQKNGFEMVGSVLAHYCEISIELTIRL